MLVTPRILSILLILSAANVQMYEHFYLRVAKEITLPILDLPMWEMRRDERHKTATK